MALFLCRAQIRDPQTHLCLLIEAEEVLIPPKRYTSYLILQQMDAVALLESVLCYAGVRGVRLVLGEQQKC